MDWKALVGFKVLLFILLSTSVRSDDDEKRVVCYYTNWSVYRPGTAKFSPQNINPYLCTHLIYAFGGFTKDNTLKPFDKYQDVDKGGYAKFTGLKTYNKDLKTLLAIGGWNEGSSRFSPMVADPERRKKFVKNALKFLRQNNFDGLDLDWEYPAHREGGKPRDKDNYADLVQELREEFEKESAKTKKPRLLLTMAVPAGIEYIEKGYDIPRLNEYLDFINLLSYDYHSAYEPAVNHHAPLYPLEEDNEYNFDNELTIDYTIKHLLKSGASSEKIVVGIPTYGRSYTLFNEDATALGSPADGPGAEGDATREKGYLAYYEICEGIGKEDWTVEKPNPKAMGPYAYNEKQWVGYDDEDIVRAKAKYVNENRLGGIMFWSIDNDDFRGKCHGRPYPLIEAAKEALLEDGEKQKIEEKQTTTNPRKRNRLSASTKASTTTNERKNGASGRRNSLARSSSDKRSSSGSKTRSRPNSRINEQKSDEEEDESRDTEKSETVETKKTSNKASRSQAITNKNRFRSRVNANERENRKKTTTEASTTHRSASNKKTTPEPPTTPDPGGDFKCEEEGFYPHPRDCKKYFWCLDSGPSGLGIVANQFTCPSGLVFNKLADSCDYPRNVICPKAKSAKSTTTTTTQRTTTEEAKEEVVDEEEDEEDEYEEEEEEEIKEEKKKEEKPKRITTTTARALLYKTINRSRSTTTSTTTTTTTAAPTTEAGSARSSDDFTDEEQDPKVIKELIDLIKKAGGIEQLEKQLALQEKGSGSNSDGGSVTPAAISKSLYQRVLIRQQGKNLFRGPSSRLPSTRKTDEVEETEEEEEVEEKKVTRDRSSSRNRFVNGPGRTQFEGLEEIPEVKSLRKSSKPKYVTIERHSSSTISSKIDDEVIDDEEEDEDIIDDNTDVASSEEKSIRNIPEEKSSPTPRSTPGYVNIRRTRPQITTETARIDEDVKEVEEQVSPSTRRSSVRPTESTEKLVDVKQETTTPKSRYISANRFRSTTIVPPKEVEQTVIETTLTPPTRIIPTTLKLIEEPVVTEGKTITVAGESGRISISPFIPDTPSTARLFSEDLSSTLRSTSPYFEEKVITPTTQYTTKFLPETTPSSNPNTIEDGVTETLLTSAVPTESSTQETIAAVSQPRPFGYPRRTRPTTATSVTQSSFASTLGFEPTSRNKVSHQLLPHHPDVKDYSDRKETNIIHENSEKTNYLKNDFRSQSDDDNRRYTPIHATFSPTNQSDVDRIVKVPVRFIDGPTNELFYLQIPENRLNISELGSVLKIEVLKTNDNTVDNVNTLNESHNLYILNDTLVPELSDQNSRRASGSKISKTNENFDDRSKFDEPIRRNDKNSLTNDDYAIDAARVNAATKPRRADELPGESVARIGNFDMRLIKSAIENAQNSWIKEKQPFAGPPDKRKLHRQRVLVYRGSTKHQPPGNDTSAQRRWSMKKVVRKRIRRTGSTPVEELETSATAIDSRSEVYTSKQPGLGLFRRPTAPGDAQPPRGIYSSSISSATKKIYPLRFGLENTRVVGITADQSGISQNLELILADPPASTTSTGKPVLQTAHLRRKISPTLTTPTSDEGPSTAGTTANWILSSEKRRSGVKYESERAPAQLRPGPYKPAIVDYDYYDDAERFVGKQEGKIHITNRGYIKCMDQGNFAHPSSCRKFISCARMVNGYVIGTEYTCPPKLSFDPIGGLCNWSAGLGCDE